MRLPWRGQARQICPSRGKPPFRLHTSRANLFMGLHIASPAVPVGRPGSPQRGGGAIRPSDGRQDSPRALPGTPCCSGTENRLTLPPVGVSLWQRGSSATPVRQSAETEKVPHRRAAGGRGGSDLSVSLICRRSRLLHRESRAAGGWRCPDARAAAGRAAAWGRAAGGVRDGSRVSGRRNRQRRHSAPAACPCRSPWHCQHRRPNRQRSPGRRGSRSRCGQMQVS